MVEAPSNNPDSPKQQKPNKIELGPPAIEKRDLSELRSRLASIIKQVSGKREVVVKSDLTPGEIQSIIRIGQDPETTWFQREIKDPKTGKGTGMLVRIPKKILETNENIAKGKAAHEAGHVAISRFSRFVPDKVLQELGFHHLMLSGEELPTDQVVRARYPGAGQWVDEARRDSALTTDILSKTKGAMGYMPKSVQFNGLLVYGPHRDHVPKFIDEDVLDLYKRLKPEIDALEGMLPAEEASEKEVEDKAKERYRLIYKKLWPEVKKLVDHDQKMEELRQMLQQASKNSGQEEPQEGDGSEPSPEGGGSDSDKKEAQELQEALSSLSEELGEEMGKAMKELEEEQEAEDAKRKAAESKPPESETTDTKEETPEEGSDETNDEDESEDGAEEGDVPMKKPGEDAPCSPIPIDKLSKKLLEALKKAYDKLPENLKKALADKARKVLEKMEDELVKELAPKMEQDAAETHQEFEERIESEKKKVEDVKKREDEAMKAEAELRDIEARQEAGLGPKNVYEQYYAELRDLDEKLYRDLEEVFTPNTKRTMKLRSTGSKINLPAVFRWEASRKGGAVQIDSKIFETVHLPEKKDYVFTLLNDLSGSMGSDDKITEDFKAKIVLTEVLNRLGIKNEILGFQDEIIVFKKFDEELTDTVRQRISGMLDEVNNMNVGGHNQASYNDDGPCLLEASAGLAKQPGKEKFLIVISDGRPEGRRSSAWDLTDAVKKIMKETDQKLIALGLGQGTEHVGTYYPISFPNISVHQLSDVIADLLRDMIVHPQKYTPEKLGLGE